MRYLLVALLLLAQAGITSCSFDLANLAADDWAWQSRENDPTPKTASEKLAAKVMQDGALTLTSGNLKAYMDGNDHGYLVVAVEETAADASEPVKKIRYKMIDQEILFESYPQYIVPIDKQREANAREVAYLAKEGRAPMRPDIYEQKYLYVPNYDGNCRVDVTEMDIERNPVFRYSFDVCDHLTLDRTSSIFR